MTKNNMKPGAFVVEIPSANRDPHNFYKRELFNEILKVRRDYPGFKVAGIDDPSVKRGIEHATNNNLITVGTAKNHDVEWVERAGFACEKGYNPVYDLISDFSTVKSKLRAYAEKNHGTKEFNLSNGSTVVIHRNFIKIGYKVVYFNEFKELMGLTPDDIRLIYNDLK